MISYTHQPEGGVCFFMKIIKCNQCRTVSAGTPEEFDEKFNEASAELGTGVKLRWEAAPFTVHLLYTEVKRIAETVKEEYEEIRGIKYYCKDCPHFDKCQDKRCGSKGCLLGVQNAVDYTPACELFYEELAQGRLKPRG